MAKTVQEILDSKTGKTICVAPDTCIFDAQTLMAQHNIGALLVLEDERLIGIFSERDCARKLVLNELKPKEVPISALMTPKPHTVDLLSSSDEVMAIMTEHRFRHLPVIDKERVVGIVSIGDIVKAVIDEQRRTIDHLASYISGGLST